MSYKKIISIFEWFSTIKWVLNHRGNDSYGRTELITAVKFFKAIRKPNLENLVLAEKFVGALLQDLWPKNSPVKLFRQGPQFDSGYTIAALDKIDNVVSGGAGKNIDFELSFALEGSSVHICDPFVDKLPVLNKNLNHYKVLLDFAKPRRSIKYSTLGEFEKIIELNPKETNLLKLDIEGSEINLLGKMGVDLNCYSQIVIELHNLHQLTEREFREKFEVLKDNLLRNHHVIFFNGNNNGILLNFGPYIIPEIIELSLLHKKYFIDTTKQNFKSTNLLQDNNNNPQRLPLPNIYSFLYRISEVN